MFFAVLATIGFFAVALGLPVLLSGRRRPGDITGPRRENSDQDRFNGGVFGGLWGSDRRD
ncbi:hypothetical protein M6D93_14410 [Jatrophihabitans telluris]|uniref:Uncharacterized protein n=1 Tax=Jatrophihabitans telluris TaxID=2038343 RepID=A0ABY4QWS7_9ACTN|nr:hypothetical protein [Jatrophihabitans telluris]UQX87486.1 hypothetical protein M6D93_14410 [Jatrophihabitans telluris]